MKMMKGRMKKNVNDFFLIGGRGGNGTDPTEDIRLWMPRIDQSDYSGIWGPHAISCRAADLEECFKFTIKFYNIFITFSHLSTVEHSCW